MTCTPLSIKHAVFVVERYERLNANLGACLLSARQAAMEA